MNTSKRKFVVVDGSSLLSTCYYAVLPREIMLAKIEEGRQRHYDKIPHSENGTYTGGIFGVLKATTSPLKKQTPNHIAFVFDKTRDTFRRKLYPDYKGTRSATLKPLKQQFVLLEQILEDVGFRALYDGQSRADDYAGSLVMRFGGQIPMAVMTEDHDYLQLISDEYNIRAWVVQSKQGRADELHNEYYAPYDLNKRSVNLPEKAFEFTAKHAFAEEGVWPYQITDLKGVQEDTSDNIPGVKRVASATSILLSGYKSVENLYETIYDVREDKTVLKELQDFQKNSLRISRPPYKALTKTEEGEVCEEVAATLSKQLATIKTDI